MVKLHNQFHSQSHNIWVVQNVLHQKIKNLSMITILIKLTSLQWYLLEEVLLQVILVTIPLLESHHIHLEANILLSHNNSLFNNNFKWCNKSNLINKGLKVAILKIWHLLLVEINHIINTLRLCKWKEQAVDKEVVGMGAPLDKEIQLHPLKIAKVMVLITWIVVLLIT